MKGRESHLREYLHLYRAYFAMVLFETDCGWARKSQKTRKSSPSPFVDCVNSFGL